MVIQHLYVIVEHFVDPAKKQTTHASFIIFQFYKLEMSRMYSILTSSKGLINETMHRSPASANSFETSATRRIFSIRSVFEKPRFLLRPDRILSPSR